MTDAVIYAERQLKTRRARRLVCIWLCDGVPDEGADVIRALLARPNRVEHVGIGLGIDLQILPPNRKVQVDDLSQLARAFEKLLIPTPGRKP